NGDRTWEKVVVCIVSDGRKKINQSVLTYLSKLGVYKEGIAVDHVVGRKVEAHIFKHTIQIRVEDKIIPIPVIFCLKEKNTKKINSHRWIFNAFSPVLDLKICVLIDVGVSIDVTALKNAKDGNGNDEEPLVSYFKDETQIKSTTKGLFGSIKRSITDNMYLAEDRILCFELFTKRNSKWSLYYDKSSQAETDVPEKISGFISQRRCWLNGTFFASLYVIFYFKNIFRSKHSLLHKSFFVIQVFYQAISLLFSWFALRNFYLTFYILCNTLANPQNSIPLPWGSSVSENIFIILRYVYFILIIKQSIVSISNKPQSITKWAYYISMYGFAIIMFYTFFAGSWLAINDIMYIIILNIKDNRAMAIFHNDTFWAVVLPLLSTIIIRLIDKANSTRKLGDESLMTLSMTCSLFHSARYTLENPPSPIFLKFLNSSFGIQFFIVARSLNSSKP
ncbi:23321_t:CDS:2, partial [Dentiscutata erythropus]